MKKFWKILGITALAAAVIPYRVEGDEVTGTVTVKSLLWKLTKKPNADSLGDSLDFKFLSFGKDEEADLFTNDPEEAVILEPGDPDFDEPGEAEAPTEVVEAEAPVEVLAEEPEV